MNKKSNLINNKTIISLSVLIGLTILGIGTYSVVNLNSVFPMNNNNEISVRKIYFTNYTGQLEIPHEMFRLAPLAPLSTIISIQTNDALYVNFNSIIFSQGNFFPDGQPLINIKFVIYLNNTQISPIYTIWIDFPSIESGKKSNERFSSLMSILRPI